MGVQAISLSSFSTVTAGEVVNVIEDDERPRCATSKGERRFCRECSSALWLCDPAWPEFLHPFALAIDTELPAAPQRVHLVLKYKASWVEPEIRTGDVETC